MNEVPQGADDRQLKAAVTKPHHEGSQPASTLVDPATGGLSARPRQAFQLALLRWYRGHARPLRIRSTREPWAVLVSEVMAQQTQVGRVDATWTAFLERFPTPSELAAAATADVLRAWSGLGHNRRAVSLQRAARAIVTEHAGQVPSSVAELDALPGVGPYTARAVAALAFGQPVAAVDTNVRRVLGRLLGREMRAGELQSLADELVPRRHPATWTHASMELGATICRAAGPLCEACPVRRWCATGNRPLLPAVSRTGARRQEAQPPFESTTRWLRGRIVARLLEAEAAAWVRLPHVIGDHGPEGIGAAVEAMRREGLVERHVDGSVRLPSSLP